MAKEECCTPPCAACESAAQLVRNAAGIAYQAENDRQAAMLDRYIEARPEILALLLDVHELWYRNAFDRSERARDLLRKIAGA